MAKSESNALITLKVQHLVIWLLLKNSSQENEWKGFHEKLVFYIDQTSEFYFWFDAILNRLLLSCVLIQKLTLCYIEVSQ